MVGTATDTLLRPILFGEVLLDRFPTTTVLGGAPLIVAWHLQGLGAWPCLISRLGQDPEAKQIQEAMAAWGLDSRGLQIDSLHGTGTVEVTLHQGQPSFKILAHQAYDFIDLDTTLGVLASLHPRLFYHGTLATRIPSSRQVLRDLRQHLPCPIFLDLNLRDPWWDRPWMEQVLAQARWLKVNQQELAVIFNKPEIKLPEVPDYAYSLQRRFGYDFLIVTLGAEGAVMVSPHQFLRQPAPPIETVVDTVGAGDALSAVAILGILRGWSVDQILSRGVGFAAEICQISGGIPMDRGMYARHLQAWAVS